METAVNMRLSQEYTSSLMKRMYPSLPLSLKEVYNEKCIVATVYISLVTQQEESVNHSSVDN